MGPRVQHIRHPSQLRALTVWRLMPSPHPNSVVIDSEILSSDKKRLWETQLSHLQNACGCEQGALGLIAGLAGYTLFLLLRSGGWGHPGRREFWIGLGIVTATTCAGKLLGLLAARRRLKRIVAEIQSHWHAAHLQPGGLGQAETRRAENRVWQTRCCGGGRSGWVP